MRALNALTLLAFWLVGVTKHTIGFWTVFDLAFGFAAFAFGFAAFDFGFAAFDFALAAFDFAFAALDFVAFAITNAPVCGGAVYSFDGHYLINHCIE
jgi:hypothetical protein